MFNKKMFKYAFYILKRGELGNCSVGVDCRVYECTLPYHCKVCVQFESNDKSLETKNDSERKNSAYNITKFILYFYDIGHYNAITSFGIGE